jgi:hypothetical protein
MGKAEVVRLTRQDAVLLLREGRAAAKAGKSALACPYNPNGDATERLRVAAWMRGYVRAKRA